MNSFTLVTDIAIFRKLKKFFTSLIKRGIDFLKSPQFKRMIVKFLNFGSTLPLVFRVVARVILGILLLIGGLLWFLPVLGIWMLPLGVLMIGTCIPFFDRKIRKWQDQLEAEIQAAEEQDSSFVASQQDSRLER